MILSTLAPRRAGIVAQATILAGLTLGSAWAGNVVLNPPLPAPAGDLTLSLSEALWSGQTRPGLFVDPSRMVSQFTAPGRMPASRRFTGRRHTRVQLEDEGLTRVTADGDETAQDVEGGDSTPGRFLWPVRGQVLSRFGHRRRRKHCGVDLKGPHGAPIAAADSGEVIFSGRVSGHGKAIVIEHEEGLCTVYSHNSTNLVEVGEAVVAGQVIGRVGQTGNASTPHVHFEVREEGRPVDPMSYLRVSHQLASR